MARRMSNRERIAHYRRLLSLRQRAPKLTTEQFCRKHGVSEATFYYWRNKLAAGDGLAQPKPREHRPQEAFVPVAMEGVSRERSADNAYALELLFPNGVVARFGRQMDATMVGTVVEAMERTRCSG